MNKNYIGVFIWLFILGILGNTCIRIIMILNVIIIVIESNYMIIRKRGIIK